MIWLLDNRDSFVFNLEQAFRSFGMVTRTTRSDRTEPAEIYEARPRVLVLSPGPGRPAEAGCLLQVVEEAPPDLPILGVCLGAQALVQQSGGSLRLCKEVFHGRTSLIHHKGQGLFQGFPQPLEVCRYHSIAADPATLPSCWKVEAWNQDLDGTRIPQAILHRELPRLGLQFHPESFRTPLGVELLRRVLDIL
ncbi:MAG TPA: aminodeoxychorismate/anthranilate synthase component II [Planctomycetes bacterium]|nr:aminodeoxychorismate/anthranilate synthase component II [Planctomycetota bacterium]